MTQLRIWWALASNFQRFLMVILPLTTTWDLYRGNWLDLAVGCVVGYMILDDLSEKDV